MAIFLSPIAEFKGFGVMYDPEKNPFFKKILMENLNILKTVAVGKALLSEIAAARPTFRGDFPDAINVMCRPTLVNFTERGYMRNVTYGENGRETVTGITPDNRPKFSPQGCPFWIAGGSTNQACNVTAAGTAGQGSVCYMNFSNVQIQTNKGEKADPFIVLAHELIHSLHCLQGVRDSRDEELWTTGIGKYSNNRMSENAFRAAFSKPLRTIY